MTAKINALPRGGEPDREPHIEWLAERSDERVLLVWASIIAVFVHGLAFMIDLPEPTVTVPPRTSDSPVIHKIPLPPPPPIEATALPPPNTVRRKPVPDREMAELDPVKEPPLVIEDRVVDEVYEWVLPPSVAPPQPRPEGPVLITPDMQRPVLIEDTKVPPEYPAIARQAGVPGEVIVQAVIRRDGSVGEVTVLRSTPPGLGFEESAIEAVRQWRYEPARQRDEPVEVYFTVYVRFELR